MHANTTTNGLTCQYMANFVLHNKTILLIHELIIIWLKFKYVHYVGLFNSWIKFLGVLWGGPMLYLYYNIGQLDQWWVLLVWNYKQSDSLLLDPNVEDWRLPLRIVENWPQILTMSKYVITITMNTIMKENLQSQLLLGSKTDANAQSIFHSNVIDLAYWPNSA